MRGEEEREGKRGKGRRGRRGEHMCRVVGGRRVVKDTETSSCMLPLSDTHCTHMHVPTHSPHQ